MEKNDHQPNNEDPLAFYRPMLGDKLSRILEKEGESGTLKELAHHPELLKPFQYNCKLCIQDISKVEAEMLVFYEWFGLDRSVLIMWSLPPKERHSGYFNLAENIPQTYVERLLNLPNPLFQLLADLCDIEGGRVCSDEIERRKLEHPELDAMIDYKRATPERDALKYLQERTLSERIQLTKKYGLNGLEALERSIGSYIGDFKSRLEKEYGIEKSTSVYLKMMGITSSRFPKFHKRICTELVKKSVILPEIGRYIEKECDLLIFGVAIDYFGLDIEGGYSLQKYEASKALIKMGEIMKLKGIAWNWRYSLLWMGFSDSQKRQEAEITSQEGLLKGINTWADKDIQDIISAALTGHLKRSLNVAIENVLKDERDKLKRVEREDEAGKYKIQRAVPYTALGKPTDDYIDEVERIETVRAREELKQSEFKDDLDTDRELLDSILPKVKLTDRERLVVDLTLDNRKDMEIALMLGKKSGRKVTEENVRQLRSRAKNKLERYVQEELT